MRIARFDVLISTPFLFWAAVEQDPVILSGIEIPVLCYQRTVVCT
jgi:hypothetical protein